MRSARFYRCALCHSYVFKFSLCSNSEHNSYSPQLRPEDESGSPGSTTNVHPRPRPRVFHATSYPRIQRPTRRRIPLDRPVTPDDPRLASHHQTHDRDDRATDHMAHRYCAARPSVEVARTALLKLLVDTLSAYPECLKVSRGPATIAPIDLVMMVLLVFGFHEKLPAPRFAAACVRSGWRRVRRQRT